MWTPGERVTLRGGTFDGMKAIIQQIDGETAVVEIDIFGRKVEQRVPVASLSTAVPIEPLMRSLRHALSLIRAIAFDSWWARRLDQDPDPIREYRAFEDHALEFEGRAEAELARIEAELRAMAGPPPDGWSEAQVGHLGDHLGLGSSMPTERLLEGRERRRAALAELEKAGETPRYIGERGGP